MVDVNTPLPWPAVEEGSVLDILLAPWRGVVCGGVCAVGRRMTSYCRRCEVKKSFLCVVLACVFVSISLGREIRVDSPDFWHILRNGAIAKFTLKIVDADGALVANANVLASFAMESSKGIEGTSDTNGLFSMKGKSRGEMHYGVRKDGYYPTSTTVKFGRHDGIVVKDGKWQPWNPTNVVVLNKIKNPVPMYARRVETFLPLAGQEVGYDLMVGDWVAPYGKGMESDFVFEITKRRVVSWMDFDASLKVKFSRVNDGFQKRAESLPGGSSFPWLYSAPENGYSNMLQVSVGYLPGKGYFATNESAACFFRVRSVTNAQGGIISAYYGKMPTPIRFDARDTKTGWLNFSYYLNPTPNDRNMEFDPKQNLFTHLSSLEEVRDP